MKYPSGIGSGDFHFYPTVPQTPEVNDLMRSLGHDSKPIFLSEYGIGSMMNVIHEARMYEQAGIRADAEDYVLMKSMADHLTADWKRFGMDVVYPYPEDLAADKPGADGTPSTAGIQHDPIQPEILRLQPHRHVGPRHDRRRGLEILA
jgi:hypothetical protein